MKPFEEQIITTAIYSSGHVLHFVLVFISGGS